MARNRSRWATVETRCLEAAKKVVKRLLHSTLYHMRYLPREKYLVHAFYTAMVADQKDYDLHLYSEDHICRTEKLFTSIRFKTSDEIRLTAPVIGTNRLLIRKLSYRAVCCTTQEQGLYHCLVLGYWNGRRRYAKPFSAPNRPALRRQVQAAVREINQLRKQDAQTNPCPAPPRQQSQISQAFGD